MRAFSALALLLALALACLPFAPSAAASPPRLAAQPQLQWWTHDAGGGAVVASGFRLDGTVGQPDTGPALVLQAGTLQLRTGYWGGLRAFTPILFADGFEPSNLAGEFP
jgi:hypothetical protein